MKKLLKIISPVLLCAVLLSSTAFYPGAKAKFKSQWKQIDANLYAQATEVSVVNYKEFLHDIPREMAEKYALDTTVWSKGFQYLDPVKENYTSHPAFYEYPAVGLSYEGAKAYCAWLTEVINNQEDSYVPFKKVLFRLPTEEEWEKAATADLVETKFPWEVLKGVGNPGWAFDKKGQPRANFKVIDQSFIQQDPETGESIIVGKGIDYTADGYMLTAPVRSFTPNPWGIYHMAGNVSEMIDTPGIAKGGSWNSTGYYLRIKSQEIYEEPSAQVGFRIFMEVLEE
ncbi:MAG: SUMF1/EgtB/PvdO family nonheme iron enzyme [Bacteroidota bacterium]